MSEKNKDSYTFGSTREKFISALEANLAFDSILFVFGIIVIIVFRKKWLNWPISIICSSFILLFYAGKGTAGAFYIIGTTNEQIHDKMKNSIEIYNNLGVTLPDLAIAWQVSYYTLIASLLGELMWVLAISSITMLAGKQIYNNSVAPT